MKINHKNTIFMIHLIIRICQYNKIGINICRRENEKIKNIKITYIQTFTALKCRILNY